MCTQYLCSILFSRGNFVYDEFCIRVVASELVLYLKYAYIFTLNYNCCFHEYFCYVVHILLFAPMVRWSQGSGACMGDVGSGAWVMYFVHCSGNIGIVGHCYVRHCGLLYSVFISPYSLFPLCLFFWRSHSCCFCAQVLGQHLFTSSIFSLAVLPIVNGTCCLRSALR